MSCLWLCLCLWLRWCSGRRRARPPARLGGLTSFGAAPRSPPVPSGPSGALHTGGACGFGVPGQVPPPPTSAAAWPRRHPWAPQLTLTNFARNSPVTLLNLECASLELQRFQRLLKLPSNELRASFPGLAVYQGPRQTVEEIVRPPLLRANIRPVTQRLTSGRDKVRPARHLFGVCETKLALQGQNP